MKALALLILKIYKKALSPVFTLFFGNTCRYQPTCSEYMYEAVEKYGALKGVFMGIKRIAKCHPFGGKGYDPVR